MRVRTQKESECTVCRSCGCNWFEQIAVQQYHKYHNVVLAQRVAPLDDVSFFLLRCGKCQEVHEPNVQIGPQDALRKKYDSLLDQLEEAPDLKDVGTQGEEV